MDDPLLRIAAVAVAAIVVVGLAVVSRRWQRPSHPRIDVAGLGFPPGIVIFTSTDCTKCKDALAALRGLDVPVREVTWELEGSLLESARVATVPLTAFVDGSGRVIDQIVGIPTARRLRRAAAAWAAAASRR